MKTKKHTSSIKVHIMGHFICGIYRYNGKIEWYDSWLYIMEYGSWLYIIL